MDFGDQYSELNVDSRTAAVATATSLGFIRPTPPGTTFDGYRSGSGRDVKDSVGATFAVGHDVVDEGVVAGFGQGEFHEAALGG